MPRHAEQDHLQYRLCSVPDRKLTCTAQFASSSRTASSAKLHTICAVLASTFRGLVSYTHLHEEHASLGLMLSPQSMMHRHLGMQTCDAPPVSQGRRLLLGESVKEGSLLCVWGRRRPHNMPRRWPLLAISGAPM